MQIKGKLATCLAILISALLIVIIGNVGWDLCQKGNAAHTCTIPINGKGMVSAKPDLAVVTFAVMVEGKTPTDVFRQNTVKMNSIIKALKGEGNIEEKDLHTTMYNLQPVYEYVDIDRTRKRVLIGYSLNQSLEVKVRKLDEVGSVIQMAVEAGANGMGGLYFVTENSTMLIEEARIAAIQDAYQKARVIAEQLNLKLKGVVGYSEGSSTPVYKTRNLSMEAMADAPPQIEEGEQTTAVTVNITFKFTR